jgi:uncharacterized membrane protein YagU involved in acid resistance
MSGEFLRPADGPTVEVPKPTIWPMVLSLGVALLAAGVATSPAFLVLGGLVFVAGLAGWVRGLLHGRGHTEELMTAPAPNPVVGRPGGVEQLHPGMPGYRFRLPVKIHPISAGVKGGLAGGLVMLLPAFAWAILSGHSVWLPVNLLAGTLLPGVDAASVAELDQFRPTLLLIGVVIHAAISLVVGLLYGVLLPTLPKGVVWQMVCGGLVVPLLWTGLSYGLMGVVNPLLRAHVDWVWYAVSQFVFGQVAAVVVVRSEQVAVAPAGGP